ncbi:MAG: enoyl-CoA hydratase/isomerase family protein [Herpetosiphonaceae bacterium]|nr:enoyl-CoA hydratase/isomerase family protein [Herpetosiphonaceae bacterium]
MLQTTGVRYELDGAVAVITLNRPERRNALDQSTIEGLTEAFSMARDAGEVRAVVLTGAGRGFCSGADLAVFADRPSPEQVYQYLVQFYQPLMQLICTIEKPVIGAINGTAAGAGAGLALACDLRVMADNGGLLQAFSNIGLVPDAGASWFFARLIGYSRAYELTIQGEQIPAARCLELGLTNRIAPADRLLPEALAWATQLAQRPTLALGLTKRALDYALQHDLASSIEYEAQLQKQTIVSDDHREGVAAFLEKRVPQFKGR